MYVCVYVQFMTNESRGSGYQLALHFVRRALYVPFIVGWVVFSSHKERPPRRITLIFVVNADLVEHETARRVCFGSAEPDFTGEG